MNKFLEKSYQEEIENYSPITIKGIKVWITLNISANVNLSD